MKATLECPEPLRRQLVGSASALLRWLEDPEVTDVLVNGTAGVFVDKGKGLESFPSPFVSLEALFAAIERLVVPTGRQLDAAQPFLDGRLCDGSRFHVILPPLAPQGPLLSIRRARDLSMSWVDPAPRAVLDWLRHSVKEGVNIVVSGGTGTGKTTVVSWLLGAIPDTERVVLLEETRELGGDHPHLVRLEARPASPDGKGEVTLRTLLRNALRMRPDRIVVGECRGAEVLDMLQALNTGHAGSLTTVHASSARDALHRLEALALLGGAVPLVVVREWIAGSVHLIAHLERAEGKRQITELLAVCGLEGERYRVSPLYRASRSVRRAWPPQRLPY